MFTTHASPLLVPQAAEIVEYGPDRVTTGAEDDLCKERSAGCVVCTHRLAALLHSLLLLYLLSMIEENIAMLSGLSVLSVHTGLCDCVCHICRTHTLHSCQATRRTFRVGCTCY